MTKRMTLKNALADDFVARDVIYESQDGETS